jgi:hypothetical protein
VLRIAEGGARGTVLPARTAEAAANHGGGGDAFGVAARGPRVVRLAGSGGGRAGRWRGGVSGEQPGVGWDDQVGASSRGERVDGEGGAEVLAVVRQNVVDGAASLQGSAKDAAMEAVGEDGSPALHDAVEGASHAKAEVRAAEVEGALEAGKLELLVPHELERQ